jgi:hypothetical protein
VGADAVQANDRGRIAVAPFAGVKLHAPKSARA